MDFRKFVEDSMNDAERTAQSNNRDTRDFLRLLSRKQKIKGVLDDYYNDFSEGEKSFLEGVIDGIVEILQSFFPKN